MTETRMPLIAPTTLARHVEGILATDVSPRDDPKSGMVLFDPEHVRAHVLNQSAAAVWHQLDGSPIADIAARLTSQLNESAGSDFGNDLDDMVLADTLSVVERLAGEGTVILDDVDIATDRGRRAGQFPNVPFTDQPAPSVAEMVWSNEATTAKLYGALGVFWRIATTDADLAVYLADVLAPLGIYDVATGLDGQIPTNEAPQNPAPHIFAYRVVGEDPDSGRTHLVTVDDHVVGQARTDSELAALVLWHVNQLVSTQSRHHLLLHASAARAPESILGGRGAVAFPASMNSGKSTLVTGLAQRGYGYLTDECVAIDLDTLGVTPYPKAIALDPGSWAFFPSLEPAVDEAHARFFHNKWYINPTRLGGATERVPVPLVALVFPNYVAGATTSIERLDPLEVAAELANNSFNLAAVGQRGLDAIAQIATTLPAWRMITPDLASALDMVKDALTTLAP